MAAMAMVAIAIAGCASGPLVAYRPDAAPTVELPLGLPPAVDARAGFAPWFADEVRRDPRFGGTRATQWLHGVDAAIDAPSATSPAIAAPGVSVLLVPGLFGDCLGAHSMPFADGLDHPPDERATAGYRRYADLGLQSLRLVEVPGRASSAANGVRLAQAIRDEAASPAVESIVLVAYSKGVADALHALDLLAGDGGAGKVIALVSIAGTVLGTPVADRFAAAYDRLGSRFRALDCGRSEGGEIDSVSRGARLAWLAAHPPPPGIAYYSLVAHAAQRELAPGLRGTGGLLSRVDPRNDGQMIAAHAVLPGSALLAEAHTDHWGIALAARADPRWLARFAGPRSDFPREALLRAVLRYVLADRAGPPENAAVQRE